MGTRADGGCRSSTISAVALAIVVIFTATARAVVATRERGLDFVTVGAPGNRGATLAEAPVWPAFAPPLGAVDHEYRIMRTNITYQQYLPFLQAYAPHYPGPAFHSEIRGLGINYLGTGPNGQPIYQIVPGQENCTATMSWRTAARFANWMHNNQVSEAWAFEDGAYDTSTFAVDPQGRPTDQFTHHPDARFWIPSIHEMAKAAYYDPDRNGPGQEGYWLHPDGGMEPLIAGPPGIGEAAGDTIDIIKNIPVGSYPDTQSPWGLWDVSSTYRQGTEGWVHPVVGVQRVFVGSTVGDQFYWLFDRVDIQNPSNPNSIIGLRLATSLPTPNSLTILLGAAGAASMNKRRRFT